MQEINMKDKQEFRITVLGVHDKYLLLSLILNIFGIEFRNRCAV
jgi:hypothetical protein